MINLQEQWRTTLLTERLHPAKGINRPLCSGLRHTLLGKRSRPTSLHCFSLLSVVYGSNGLPAACTVLTKGHLTTTHIKIHLQCPAASSSALPATFLGFSILGEIFAYVTFFLNPTIAVVTFFFFFFLRSPAISLGFTTFG